jgi:hypothetical protein
LFQPFSLLFIQVKLNRCWKRCLICCFFASHFFFLFQFQRSFIIVLFFSFNSQIYLIKNIFIFSINFKNFIKFQILKNDRWILANFMKSTLNKKSLIFSVFFFFIYWALFISSLRFILEMNSFWKDCWTKCTFCFSLCFIFFYLNRK